MVSSFAERKQSRSARQPKSFSSTSAIDAATASTGPQAFDHEPRPRIDELELPHRHEAETSSAGSSRPAVSETYDLPPVLELRQSASRGRGLYAVKPIQAGSVVFRTCPTISVLSSQHLADYCSGCGLSSSDISLQSPGQPPRPLKRCTLCRLTFYCSTQCQRDDWTLHKQECAAHKALKAALLRSNPGCDAEKDRRWVMSERTRFLGRLCWKRRLSRVDGSDTSWWKAVSKMESHVKSIPETEVFKLGKEIQQLQYYLAMSASSGAQDTPTPADMRDFGFQSTAELLNLISAFMVNSFTLSSPSLSPLGVAMSPTAALFNHSCSPNAVVVFPNGSKEMVVVAIANIEAGQEVLTSYVDVSLPRHMRQTDLKKQYGFDCDCTLCALDLTTNVDPNWCVRHASHGGQERGNIPAHEGQSDSNSTYCNQCGKDFTIDTSRLAQLQEQGRSILERDGKDALDQAAALEEMTELLPSLLRLVPPSTYPASPLLRLQALLLTSSGRPQDLRTAAFTLSVAYQGAEATHPPGHPTLAVILASWGKLLAIEPDETVTKVEVLEKLTEAVKVLRRAVTACERGFGPGGGLMGKEVVGILQGCEGELALLRRAP